MDPKRHKRIIGGKAWEVWWIDGGGIGSVIPGDKYPEPPKSFVCFQREGETVLRHRTEASEREVERATDEQLQRWLANSA